ncbi:putative bifunctional diguanylate cyclase/phosphodiesterase [Marinobacter sp. 1-4A]|uniref:putative bifunctional diguanylate cyclase/phosphodiesterase n=1 Tax=Marinobacter sp. 1-4A TaxID=2582919 RepID=UPI0022344810|nr:EAL domain-containing protein [Marinobacter sp. 1-4A]
MYEAKQDGRGNFQFYSSGLTDGIQQQDNIEQALKLATQTNSFQLVYQPVLDINTLEVVSVEALLRLQNGSEIGPEQFVPIAEATGIINSIGRWVIEEAMRQSASWSALGLPAIPIAVNVSAVEFRDLNFVDRFEQLIDEYSVEPTLLQLEVTETAMMHDLDHTIASLSRLRDLGVAILLDDFGAGHSSSSLTSLSRLPLDKVKIDKSFLHQLENDSGSRAVTDAVLALGLALDLQVVAEGIETTYALEYVRSQGCTQAQGFLFCKPISGEEFERWYRAKANSQQNVGT